MYVCKTDSPKQSAFEGFAAGAVSILWILRNLLFHYTWTASLPAAPSPVQLVWQKATISPAQLTQLAQSHTLLAELAQSVIPRTRAAEQNISFIFLFSKQEQQFMLYWIFVLQEQRVIYVPGYYYKNLSRKTLISAIKHWELEAHQELWSSVRVILF